MKKLITMVMIVAAGLSVGSTAFAGEQTGGPDPKPTPIDDFGHARSICAFSGLNDDPSGDGGAKPLEVGKVQNWGHTRANAKALYTAEGLAAYVAGHAPGVTCNGHTGIIATIFP